MIRLYVNTPLTEGQQVFLDESQSHYVQRVMRLKPSDNLLLFNGQDGEWQTQIVGVAKKTTRISLISQNRPQPAESKLWVLFSPLKPKRQEFLIEKATELGASGLWPIRCERTSIPKINLEKMRAQAREAAEQCGRLSLPEIHDLTPLPHIHTSGPQIDVLLFGDETLNAPPLSHFERDPQKVYGFFVGPEGGFTSRERDFLKTNAQGVTLNANILRAETAALAGISYLQLP